MKLLLDTHILIWAASGDLPKMVIPYISDPRNTLFFSPASIWEVVIKNALGRPDFQLDPAALHRGLLENGYLELIVGSRHVLAVAGLPPIHKDPFDRLLLAQARAEGLKLLTADDTIARYKDAVLCIKS